MKLLFRSFARTPKRLILLPLLILLLTAMPGESSLAAENANITSCKLKSSKEISVRATLFNRKAVVGANCYLFALTLSDSGIPAGAAPLTSAAKTKHMTFSVAVDNYGSSGLLYSRFVLAQRNGDGSYTPISNARYVSNPKKAAVYKYSFPTAASKKGLQVNAEMLEDAEELNVQHAALNIVLSDLIAAPGEKDSAHSIACNYQGEVYWFRRSAVSAYDRQLTALKRTNATVSAILLLGWRSDLTHLIYPSGRQSGHSLYAWNTADASARRQLQACVYFLASRYSTAAAVNGRIVNWIIGNEVNNYKVYNYAGELSLARYAQVYADAFRLAYTTISGVYRNARVYISLDHLWNTNTVAGTFPAREMLDAFANALNNQGSIPWNLAYHPYSSPLTEPKFWENKNKQLTKALTSPVINMGNIGLLTSYIRQTYGQNTRIILSEQGYTSVQAGKNVEKEQSAAIAYSYYLTEADDMIDSFIMNRHVDHQVEVAQGLNLGLWTTQSGAVESAGIKKDSWSVFKYMDTNKSKKYTSPLLSIIGAKSWKKLIEGFSSALYAKTAVASAKLRSVVSYQARAAIASGWAPYGAVSSLTGTQSQRIVKRDSSRNRNVLWGFSQNFSKGLNFTVNPVFYTTLIASGSSTGNVTLKLRFFSGSSILESEKVIKAGQPLRFGVSLANWKYKNNVTRIQVLLAPITGGSWSSDAYLGMTLPVQGQ